jgi:hypothetical protein
MVVGTWQRWDTFDKCVDGDSNLWTVQVFKESYLAVQEFKHRLSSLHGFVLGRGEVWCMLVVEYNANALIVNFVDVD